MTLFGTSEAATYPTELHEGQWEYMRFSPFFGHEYRCHDGELYELVLVRKKELDLFQGVFATFPKLSDYFTHDLFSKHPTRSDLWIYRGRSDDIISFTNAEKFNPVDMERTISAHPAVLAAIVSGHGRPQASLLIQPRKLPTTEEEREDLLDEIWPTIERANLDCPAHGRIMKDFVIFSTKDQPMTWTGKETVTRKMTTAMYQEELDNLYAMSTSTDSQAQQQFCTSIDGEQSIRGYLRNLISIKMDTARVNCSDNIFDMGFDSLQVAAMVRQINAFISMYRPDLDPVSSTEVYDKPSIEKLEVAIEESHKESTSVV
ncbi:hypothetical protein MMC13_004646 [Lambiella insularis]|nr:hypothetical protein [Lambiella insularis]